MVNNSWKSVTLSQIGTLQKGSGISRAESNSGMLPAVRYGELYTVHNNYVRTYTSHISREVANKALRVHYGDVLFACSGETKEDIAKCAAIIDNSEVYAGGDIIVLSPTTEIDPIFLGFILNTQNVIQQRAQKAQGDAIVHISADSIKSIEITVPEYAEQVKIAKVLYGIDTLIVNLEKLIAKKKAIKQGAMQELLTGKRRLPGFDGAWVTVSLQNASCDVLNGDRSDRYPSGDDFKAFGVPFINAGHLQNNKVSFENMDYIAPEHFDLLSGVKLQQGDLLFCLRGSLGKFAIVDFDTGAPASSLCAIRCRGKLLSSYLPHLLASDIFKRLISNANTGSSQPNLSAEGVAKFEVTIPEDADEQLAIANVLNDLSAEIESFEEKLIKYSRIKQAMMSELLTGRIRLIDKEDA